MQKYTYHVKTIKRVDYGLKKIFKRCKDCNEFLFIKDFVKRSKHTYRNSCKKCTNLKRRKTPVKPTPKEGYKYCTKCNKELLLSQFNFRKGKYFSWCKECEHEYNNNKYEHTCKCCGKTYRSGKKNSTICIECHNKEIAKIGTKVLNAIDWSGKNNPNYNPNLTDEERAKGRHIEGYKEFTQEVYKRDYYTCQCCGIHAHKLNAHHIYGYTEYKELRTDINNGITLCIDCHREYHKRYGYKNNNLNDFEEFLNDKLEETKNKNIADTINKINSRLKECLI